MYIRSNRILHGYPQVFSDILCRLNEKYNNNVTYNRIEKSGRKIIVTLRVKNSRGRGSKIGFTGKRTVSACFHVYKDFIDEIYKIDENAKVESALYKYKDIADFINNYDKVGDKNVGSILNPMRYEDMCKCYYWSEMENSTKETRKILY